MPSSARAPAASVGRPHLDPRHPSSAHLRDAFYPSDTSLDDAAHRPVEGDRGNKGRKGNVIFGLDGACRMGELRYRNDHQKGRILNDLDGLIADHWDGRKYHLRENDPQIEFPPMETKGGAGIDSFPWKLNPNAAQDLGHVAGIVDDDCYQP